MSVLLASADELNMLLGVPGGVEEDRADFLLTLASGLALDEAGIASTTWTAETVKPSVKAVVLAAAARAVDNPVGDDAEAVGGFSVTHGSNVAAGVYLTPGEAALCRRAGSFRGPVSTPLANRYGETLRLPS